MKSIPWPISAMLFFLSTAAGAQTAPPAGADDSGTKEVLAAMSRTSTTGHPDLAGEFAGMQAFARGDFAAALKGFEQGARYGDKLSQLSIGLMYLNGQGVDKDPVTAFAWVAIAAERKYPRFLDTRDRIWADLDAQQREKGKALVEQLYGQYGDLVAKPRLEHAMHQSLADMTGTGLSYATGNNVVMIVPDQYKKRCTDTTINGAPVSGCGENLQDKSRWDPKEYMKLRDGTWTGTVTVGEVQSNTKTTPAGSSAGK
jgi:uncharacterized protein